MRPAFRRRALVAALVGALMALAACGMDESGQQRPAAETESQAEATPAPEDDPDALLPDLTTLPASSVQIQVEDGDRLLRFGTTLANIGVGPVEVIPDTEGQCPDGQRAFVQEITLDADGDGAYDPGVDVDTVRRDGACAVFHDDHDHWHIDGSARYDLQNTAGETQVRERKVSFCLRDTDRVPGAENTADETYGECAQDALQGISPGWGDLYDSDLSGQAMPLPDSIDDGTYCLVMTADPFDQLADADRENNASVTPIAIDDNEATASSSTACADI